MGIIDWFHMKLGTCILLIFFLDRVPFRYGRFFYIEETSIGLDIQIYVKPKNAQLV